MTSRRLIAAAALAVAAVASPVAAVAAATGPRVIFRVRRG